MRTAPVFYRARDREEFALAEGTARDRARFQECPRLSEFTRVVEAGELNGMQGANEWVWVTFNDEPPWTRFRPGAQGSLVATLDRKARVIRRRVHLCSDRSVFGPEFYRDEIPLEPEATQP